MILAVLDHTVTGILFLVALVLFLVAALAADRVPARFSLVALGLAFFTFPFMYDAFDLAWLVILASWETFGGFLVSLATLITASVGGWVALKRLRQTHDRVDAAADLAQDVYTQVNGVEAEPGEAPTLGQIVREIRAGQQQQSAELAALRRELGVE